MARKLIVCCDGTWNETESAENGKLVATNVLKFTRALLPINPSDNSNQIIFYDAGVGTGNALDKLLGGAFGMGIERNIQDAYRFLATNYMPGDEIFCLGFSRGAYTVRSLCGLIDTIGLLTKTDLEQLPAAYKYYRTPPNKRGGDKNLRTLDLIQAAKEADRLPQIKFVGVWDTVGALGVPTPLLGRISRSRWVGFHDTSLGENIQHAYHALAIDEQRGSFRPNLWTSTGKAKQIKQVWFAGVHSNIGGGYPDSGLSDITLEWMIKQAQQQGLVFDANYINEEVKPNDKGQIVDSYSGLYRMLEKLRVKPFIRHPAQAIYGMNGHQLSVNEFIHPSVINRWHDSSAYYRPQNLDEAILAELPVYQLTSDASPTDKKVTQISEQDRRLRTRTTLKDINGTLSINGHTRDCQLLDISKGRGLRIHADILMPAGCDIEVKSELTGAVSGRVMWTQDKQAGIRLVA